MSRENRPTIVGPEVPEKPYPVCVETTVIPGYGRGSADLGIPTANIPQEAFDSLNVGNTGIYYGWASVHKAPEDDRCKPVVCPVADRTVRVTRGDTLEVGVDAGVVFPMVMSVGWNPYYHNKTRSAELHIIHKFADSFYGAKVKFMVVGYIRPELDYISKEALIDDINTDIKVTLNCLERPAYAQLKNDAFFQ
jgi:riboflavin kinase